MEKVPEFRNDFRNDFFSLKRKFPKRSSGITDHYGIPERSSGITDHYGIPERSSGITDHYEIPEHSGNFQNIPENRPGNFWFPEQFLPELH